MDNKLKDIIYKKSEISNKEAKEELLNKSDKWLINQFQNVLEEKLKSMSSTDQKLEFLNNFLTEEEKFSQYKNLEKSNLSISKDLSLNNLIFSLGKYIEEEFQNSTEVLFISPFISSTMINKLRTWMNNNKKLKVRIITTTYDGTSKYLSLNTLILLKNDFKDRLSFKVENSFEKYGSRIHIKAYCFKRQDDKFGNLYVGSNNFTNTGMYIGREYSIKVSEFREKELFKNFILEFEKIWESDLIDCNDENELTKILEQQKRIDAINIFREKEIREVFDKSQKDFGSIKLFSYQQEAIDSITQREKEGFTKHLLVMATGTGKTITVAKYFEKLLKESKNNNLKLLFLVHQKEILDQTIESFEKIIPNFKKEVFELYDGRNSAVEIGSKRFVFSTFQTFNLNLETIKNIPDLNFDLAIVDEVHHIEAKSFNQVFTFIESISNSLIGLTATPERTDQVDIKKYFGYEYAYDLSLHEALSKNLLSSFEYFYINDDSVSLSGIDINNENLLGQILGNHKRNDFVLEQISKNIGLENIYKSAVLFCASVEHAESLKNYLKQHGLNAESITTSTNKEKRKLILQNFKEKKINYLCVRDILNEGVDVPDIDVIMFLRPTQSLLIFVQQLGRGLRKRPDKKLEIYDFVNNVDLYVNKKYDPLLLFKIFGEKNTLKINEIKSSNTIDFAREIPDGSNVYLEYTLEEELIKKMINFDKNRTIKNIIKNYKEELIYENYEKMFIENSHIEKFNAYKMYSKKNVFFDSNVKFSLALARLSINNSKQVIERWKIIVENKAIDLNNVYDKLFVSAFCNNKSAKIIPDAENDLNNFVKKLLEEETLVKEISYLLKYKMQNENLIEDVNLKGMYVTFDQIKILNNECIIDNKFKKNTSQIGIYKSSFNNKSYVIQTSEFTKNSKYKHTDFYNGKTKIMHWESPDSWDYSKPEKIDLANTYRIYYVSKESANLFDQTIREYVGTIKKIKSKKPIKVEGLKHDKISYEFEME